MISGLPPFWTSGHPTRPIEWPPKQAKPPFNWKKWLICAVIAFVIDNNMIWWFYWEKAQHQYHVRIVRVYTTVQGPCIPP